MGGVLMATISLRHCASCSQARRRHPLRSAIERAHVTHDALGARAGARTGSAARWEMTCARAHAVHVACTRARVNHRAMFCRVTVSFRGGRGFTLYFAERRVEIFG